MAYSGDLIGREGELAQVGTFLDGVASGPATLLIEGRAGIGKTRVWRAGLEQATRRSVRVLATHPAPSEAKLSFTGLGDILEGVEDESLTGLPGPQRSAIEVATLRAEAAGLPPDQRTVGVGLLGVLRSLSESGPVVVAVDDIQWLDGPSARVLGFAARRLTTEAVGLLATARVDGSTPGAMRDALGPSERVQTVPLGPLSLGALARLLEARLGVTFPRSVMTKLHQTSGGNPFFAIAIAEALVRAGGTVRPGEPLPVPDDLQELLRARLRRMSPYAQQALLMISLLADPTPELLARAIGDEAPAAQAEVEEAGVLEIAGGRIRLAHPLSAWVINALTSATQRREAHRRLAEVVADPEDRARHRALAAEGPDDDVAAALDEGARRARARGAPDAAAELAEQAAALTTEAHPDLRLRRMADAGSHHFAAGDAARAAALLQEVVASSPPGLERARDLWTLGRMSYIVQSFAVAEENFAQALLDAEGDSRLSAAIQHGMAFSAWIRGDLEGGAARAGTAQELAEDLGDSAVLAPILAAVAFGNFVLGRGLDRALMDRALRLKREDNEEQLPIEWRTAYLLSFILMSADDLDGARQLMEALHQGAVDRGDEGSIPTTLFSLSQIECWAGSWELADRHATEAVEMSRRAGQTQPLIESLYARTLIDAHLGRIPEARAAADEGLELAGQTGSMQTATRIIAAQGFLELSLGDPRAARARLEPMATMVSAMGLNEPALARFVPDYVEALIALGDLEAAGSLIEQLDRQGHELDRSWALATAARCRGLLLAAQGDLSEGLAALEGALREHERLPRPFELARTLLAKGRVERRAKQWGAARISLGGALALFEGLGAALWVAQASDELGRVGGRLPVAGELSATERKVAELIASGLTTRQVADAVFLSPKSVEANLGRIYRKLGVRSRAELGSKMASSGDED